MLSPGFQRARRSPWKLVLGAAALAVMWSVLFGTGESITDYVGGALITILGSAPMVIWARNPERFGIPIWPAFCVLTIPAYGFPLLRLHELAYMYSEELRFSAALAICAYLFFGTVAWRAMATRSIRRRPYRLVLAKNRAKIYLPLALIGSVTFKVLLTSGLVWGLGSLIGPFRAVAGGCFLIAIWFTCGQWHSREVTPPFKVLFVACFLLYCLASMSTLYLHEAIVAVGTAVVAYFLHYHKLPWSVLIAVGIVLAVLQPGKSSMRMQNWTADGGRSAHAPGEYVSLFGSWIETSLDEISADVVEDRPAAPSVIDRFGIVHMLMLTMERTEYVGYLNGKTYTHIPSLFLPRFLAPDRVTSLQGTFILSLHFGLQSYEGTQNTTIGWGMPAEAWANFGFFGLVALGLLLGGIYGHVANLGRGMPQNAFFPLLSFFFLALAANTEVTLDVLVASAFQGTIALGLIAIVSMTREPNVITSRSNNPIVK